MTTTQALPGMDAMAAAAAVMAACEGSGRAVGGTAEIAAPPRLRRPDRRQVLLEPVCWEDRLPADHRVRAVCAVVEGLNLSAIESRIAARGETPGRASTDPRLLVALWLYATIENVGSARQLARLCGEHDAYRWLCGGVTLNHHTLSDFRVEHGGAGVAAGAGGGQVESDGQGLEATAGAGVDDGPRGAADSHGQRRDPAGVQRAVRGGHGQPRDRGRGRGDDGERSEPE